MLVKLVIYTIIYHYQNKYNKLSENLVGAEFN